VSFGILQGVHLLDNARTAPAWRQEINKDNPLGMSGAVAEHFGDLIHQLWSPTSSAFAPRGFKTMIGRFRPMFIGWSQQDSQEFLSFLLDGLHEDLNRIIKKPATVKPEWEGGKEAEMWAMAVKSWSLFKLRNDSVIVDLFQGMYRSTVVCPDCGKVSAARRWSSEC
jgi:ubiquitin carboxyl-terminal hydrolase 4/11/15